MLVSQKGKPSCYTINQPNPHFILHPAFLKVNIPMQNVFCLVYVVGGDFWLYVVKVLNLGIVSELEEVV